MTELHSAPSFRLDGKRRLCRRRARHRACGGFGTGPTSGAHVTLLSRTRGEIEEAAARSAPATAADTLVLDVTDLSAMQAAIAKAEPFNILINNAGTNRPKR